ncbi:unnamed protein product [Parnassius mnemosyne]|uniref:HTH CENPB-type domain-containing protein n=1 Tax=Parnassius mnemosyne TaxID=213953 RepID=A0AAV1LKR3_9NEOP
MPNKYQRKACSSRGNWSEESLKAAMDGVKKGEMTIYAASITYQVPRKTLERRYKKNNDKKGPMGPSSIFGEKNEKKLANHIKTMQKHGFPLTIDDVRKIAYQFAEQLNLNHRFNRETEKAGYDWLQGFLRRNHDITLRKSEGVSLARSTAMNKLEVDAYFELLESILTVDDGVLKPSCIFNMDETGLQLNNRPGHVLAEKGSKAVSTVTSTEKGETITVIACCNAEGTFLPPACIMKGKNKKPEFEDGMPPGSKLFMSPKSAYITSDLFIEWLKTHFVPRKPAGRVLLLLDGHSTHCNSVEMLEYANDNDINLLSMPSHTSHYLQPLDRTVFKSLKTHFYEQCRLWLKQNPGRRITRLSFGRLLNKAWGKAASAENAIAGFKATGVHPFNPSAIPDYAFTQELTQQVSKSQNECTATVMVEEQEENTSNIASANLEPVPNTFEVRQDISLAIAEPNSSVERIVLNASPEMITRRPKKLFATASAAVIKKMSEQFPPRSDLSDQTPTRILKQISPVPQKIIEVRKRAKQVGMLLTSENHIKTRKFKGALKKSREQKNFEKDVKKERKIEIKPIKRAPRKRKSLRKLSESSDEDEELILCNSSDEEDGNRELDNCVGCGENYYETQLIEDWIQCVICQLWVYENCTEFDDKCSSCGQKKKNELRLKNLKGKSD